jgi:formate-dependent nitrite reductase membrane component NrfD
MWSEQQESQSHVTSGNPAFNNSSASALLSYDVAHAIPWDWKVSLYTWTKGLASGTYLLSALLVLFGFLSAEGSLWLWVTPIISGAFLGITGGLLIWDLEHPERFYLIFTRPQWRSWLVKGAFIIAGYSLILIFHFLSSWWGSITAQRWLMIFGIPLSILTAVYTAYLFAQAKARDMWQNPLLPPHLLIQAVLLGAAAWLPLAIWFQDGVGELAHSSSIRLSLLGTLATSSLFHLLMVWGEVSLTHPTAHARVAIWEMLRGRYKSDFSVGIILSILGGALPGLALLGYASPSVGVGGAPLALIGLMLFENAYVQAGQSVPLA